MSSSESEIGSPDPPPFDPQNVTEEQLLDIVNDAEHADGDIRKLALTRARLISSVHSNLEEAIDKLINCGLVAVLVHHLDTEGNEVKLEAAWTLSNIASGNSRQTKVVIESGAVEKLILLLSCPNHTLSEQSLWALANILGDGHEGRDYVLGLGALDVVLSLLSPERGSQFRETLSWFVVNIFRDTMSPPSDDVISRTLPMVHMLMYEKISMVANDMVWSLIYLAQLGERYIQMIIDAALIPHVIHQFNFGTHQVEMAALDAMIALFKGSKNQVEYIVKCGALQHLANEFHYSGRKCMKVLEALENLLLSSPVMVAEVLAVGLGPLLLDKITEQTLLVDQKTYARIITHVWNTAVESDMAQLLLDWDLVSGMVPRIQYLKPECQEIIIRGINNVLLDLDNSARELKDLCAQIRLEDENLITNLGRENQMVKSVEEEVMNIIMTVSLVMSGRHEPKDNNLSLKLEGPTAVMCDSRKVDRSPGIADQKFVVVACEKCGSLPAGKSENKTSCDNSGNSDAHPNIGDTGSVTIGDGDHSVNKDASTSGGTLSASSDLPWVTVQAVNGDVPGGSVTIGDGDHSVDKDASTSGETLSASSDVPWTTVQSVQSVNVDAPGTSSDGYCLSPSVTASPPHASGHNPR